MSFTGRFLQLYFDHVYNPVYDFVVGHLNHYHELQRKCVERLEPRNDERILCAGLGTGNEIRHLLKASPGVHITGVDFSAGALKAAREKAFQLGKSIETHEMDVGNMQLPSGVFDGVLCLHVMDFVRDGRVATRELLRVLRENGRFIITYPSDTENLRMGGGLLKDTVRFHLKNGRNRISAILDPLVRMAVGMVYLPLLLRPGRKKYKRDELSLLMKELVRGDFFIEDEPLYSDFVVFGRKGRKKA